MPAPLKVLLVEDNPGDERLIREYAADHSTTSCIITSCTTLDSGLAYLSTHAFDVVLLDLSLPDSHGLHTVKRVSKHAPMIPIVILTGADDRSLAEQSIKLGAQDYLTKQTLTADTLCRTLHYAVERSHVLHALQESESRHRLLFESAPVGIVYFTVDGTIISINNLAAKRWGRTQTDCAGANIRSISTSPLMPQRIRIAQETRETQIYEDSIEFPDGPLYVLRSFTAIRDASDKVIGVQMITSDITAQKNAEIRFHLAATVASDLVYEWILDTDVVTWYGDIDGALGFDSGTIPHTFTGWESLVHPEDRARIQHAPLSHRTASVPIHQEYRVKTADGHWRTWIDRATPVLNDRGHPVRWIGVCEDITSEREAALTLEEEQMRLQSVMEAMPAFLYLQAPDHTIPYANGRFREYFGDPAGRRCHDIFRENTTPCDPCQTLRVLDAREEVIREWTDNRGRLFELRERPYKTSDGQEYVLVIGVEITDLVQATAALRSSERRFRELAEMLPEGVFECNLDGHLTFVNQAAFDQFGYTRDQFATGLNTFDMMAEQDVERIRGSVGRLLAGGEEHSTRYSARRRDGSTFPAIIHSSLVRQDGEPIGLRGIIVDITKQVEAQDALSESESRLRAVLDTVPDLLFQLDAEDRVCMYHAPAEQLYALPEEFLGTRIGTTLPAESSARMVAALQALKQSGKMQMVEYSLPIQGVIRDYEARLIRGDVGHTLIMIRDISERKQAQSALELAASIIRSTPIGMLVYRYEEPDRLVLVDANPKAAMLMGIRRSQWRNEEFTENWLEAQVAGITGVLLNAFKTDTIFSSDILDHQDKRIAGNFRIRAFRVPGDRLVVSFEDMSEQIAARRMLRESEERYRNIVEMSPVGIVTVSAKGKIASANHAFLAMTGYESEEIVGRHITKIPAIHARDLPKYLRTFSALARGQIPRPFESSWTAKDGQERQGEIQVALLIKDADKKWSVQVIVQDVTDRHETEEALRRSEAEYRSLFENAALGIYRTSPDGHILAANNALIHMLGFESFEQLAQRNLEDEGYEPTTPRIEFKRLMEQLGHIEGLEASWLRKDGSTVVVREHARAVRDSAGNIAYYEGTLEEITERVTAERRLRESEATQRGILHASPIGIGLIRDGKFQWISDRISEMSGYSAEELIGQSPLLTAPNQSEFKRIQRDMDEEMVRCGVAETETQWKRKDGSPFDVNLRLASLDPADPSKGGIFTLLDISDRKQMETSLQLTQHSIDSTDVIILWLRPSGEVFFANEAACRLLGYTREELLNRHAWDITVDYPRARREALWNELKHRGTEASETLILRRDGSSFPAELTAQFLDFQGSEYEFVFAVDISERKIAEAALLQSEENYRTIFDSASDSIMLHDAETGRLLDGNERIHDMFGYSVDEFLTLQVVDFSSDEPEYSQEEALMRIHAAAEGAPQVFEWHARKKDGEDFWVEVSLRRVALLGNSVVLAIVRNISERKELEAQLRQGQKLESIGTLASGVAHEINNPLMGMINYAELISSRVKDDSLRTFAEGIKEEGDRVAKIVRNLLTFSRQDQEEHSQARMADIVAASLSLIGSLLRKDFIQMEINVPEDLPVVRCRSQQIQQVFINLVTNARDSLNTKYPDADTKKRLRITSRVLYEGEKSWLRATVEDFGNGISEDLVNRIFDPFFTTKARNEGTGLGLSISYGIVRDHNGRLTVESEPGQFTQFHVDLPLADNEAT